jgi:hypothetical protein
MAVSVIRAVLSYYSLNCIELIRELAVLRADNDIIVSAGLDTGNNI